MENDNKKLPGEITLTHSSDEYISTLESRIESEAYGVNEQIVDVSEEDLFEPLSIGTQVKIQDENSTKSNVPSNPKPNDAAFLVNIIRKKLDKKAA